MAGAVGGAIGATGAGQAGKEEFVGMEGIARARIMDLGLMLGRSRRARDARGGGSR